MLRSFCSGGFPLGLTLRHIDEGSSNEKEESGPVVGADEIFFGSFALRAVPAGEKGRMRSRNRNRNRNARKTRGRKLYICMLEGKESGFIFFFFLSAWHLFVPVC